MVIPTLKLVKILNLKVEACDTLSKSIGIQDRKYKYGGHSAYPMQKSTENVLKLPTCRSL